MAYGTVEERSRFRRCMTSSRSQPKKIVLSNGLVIFLQEDHELPFVNGFDSDSGRQPG